MFSLSKRVTLWQTYFHGQIKVQHFHGQSTKFHGQTELRVITRLVGVVHSSELLATPEVGVGREKGLAQYTSVALSVVSTGNYCTCT